VTTPSLVLFDVDGTLITSGGAGARSWRYAFDQLHGVPADIDSHSRAGETDPVVARKTFEGAVGREPTERELAAIFALYLRRLSHEVATSEGYRVLDGAVALLTRLSDAGIMLGIVSGGMEGAARVKLGRGDLNRFFLFGGYGTDSSDRTELTSAAIARASLLHDHAVDPAHVYVVGDTPLDVAAAKAAGAVSVAVASGVYPFEALASAGADHVLPTLAAPFPSQDVELPG
jgi:phosphoglycolate phosphatase-like HAD superfamily hydrolase